MAEAKPSPAAEAASSGAKPSGNKVNFIVMFLVLINTAVVGAVAFMVFKSKQKETLEPGLPAVQRGEEKTQIKEAFEKSNEIKPIIPLETFVVNLSGSRGRRVAKVNVELEVSSAEAKKEVERRQAQIRDIIILLLSSKTHETVSSIEGKDALRSEVKERINSLLSEGRIENIYFTEFIYN